MSCLPLNLPGRLILASTSPRRAAILEQVKIPFTVRPSSFDEAPLMKANKKTEEPGKLVEQIARGKANAVELEEETDILVAADTVIYVDGEIKGKPADIDEARNNLKAYAGKQHHVYTGVCLKYRDICTTFHVASGVKFGENKDSLIEWYLTTGEYKDKAGGYGTQAIGAALVAEINGCYYNIMGLPIHRLIQEIMTLTH